MINAHIHDGVALTKFLYWIKEVNKKKITEFEAQEKLRKLQEKKIQIIYTQVLIPSWVVEKMQQ